MPTLAGKNTRRRRIMRATVQIRLLVALACGLGLLFIVTVIHQQHTYSSNRDVNEVRLTRRHVVHIHQKEHTTDKPVSTPLDVSVHERGQSGDIEWTAAMEKRMFQLRDRLEELANVNASRIRPAELSKLPKKTLCEFYNTESLVDRIFIPRVWGDLSTIDTSDITIATQFSLGKISVLSVMAKNYQGPISAAIELDIDEMFLFLDLLPKFPSIVAKENLDIHIILSNGTLYPVNFMRNVALNYTQTDYVFLDDIDFIPSFGLNYYVKKIIAERNNSNEVYVIPAMEFTTDAGLHFPRNMSELVYYWDMKIILSSGEIHWIYGHRMTNYKKWKFAKEAYTISYEDGFEPYIIAKTEDIPRYNTSFFAGYRDKMSHLVQVNASGFQFVVVPEHFVLHYPHVRTSSTLFHPCGLKIYEQLRVKLLGANAGSTPNTKQRTVRRVVRRRIVRRRRVIAKPKPNSTEEKKKR